MPARITYPGVYVEEVPGGFRAIVGVETSRALFIGHAARGPLHRPSDLFSAADFDRAFAGSGSAGEMAHAVRLFFANGGRRCCLHRIASGATPAVLRIPSEDGATPLIDLQSRESGVVGNGLRAQVTHPSAGQNGGFDLSLWREAAAEDGAIVALEAEVFEGLSMDAGNARYAPLTLNRRSRLVTASVPAAPASALAPAATGETPLAGVGGSDGVAPTFADYEAAFAALERDLDLFNLLVLPPTGDAGLDMARLYRAASLFCRRRRAVLIMDPPVSWNSAQQASSDLPALRAGLATENSALYLPRLRIAEEGGEQAVGPAGAIAGLIARIDSTRGVWRAPAGTSAALRGISGLDWALSATEIALLNPQAVNTIRQLDGGIVCWGARTNAGSDEIGSDWKYLPVRRLALFIEESLRRGLLWAIFEPNAEPLWSQIRGSVVLFLQTLFRDGAFAGETPLEAFFVKCDATTTTQADRDSGIVNLLVGVAPLRPAEFVILQLQLLAGRGERQAASAAHAAVARADPYGSFRFTLRWDGRAVAGASKVSALDHGAQRAVPQAFGDPAAPLVAGLPAVVALERGVTLDRAFDGWARLQAATPHLAGDLRRDIVIEVKALERGTARHLTLHRCRISRYRALPDLDAGGAAVAIETLVLEAEGWSRGSTSDAPPGSGSEDQALARPRRRT